MPTDTHCIKDKGTKRRNEKKERKEGTKRRNEKKEKKTQEKNNLPV